MKKLKKINGITQYVTRAEFAAAIGRSERTICRYEKSGLPVTCKGRTRLIPVERGFRWLEGEGGRRGRPRNVDLGTVSPE